MGNQQKTKIKKFNKEENIKIRFNNVAGLKEAKVEISELVDFLKNPQEYEKQGAKLPRGALLTGPPGTGKTLLAKACAGEAGVPFYYTSGSEFVEKYVGVGAKRVRDLFKEANYNSPCIIFIDEIDAIGRSRYQQHDESAQTLNQLLVEMDGFNTTDNQVIVLAATNRKDMLDQALTRPGRFDRQIEFNLPDLVGREEIFMEHLQKLKLNPVKTLEQYAKRLATISAQLSGADIMNLCNEAAILAARNNQQFVNQKDFEMASERIIGGLIRTNAISEKERKIVAIHEAGHAVMSWFLEGGNPLLKVTIIPRTKGALGFAQYLPNESSLQTKEELLDQIICILGGRVAEEHFFESVTTGAYDDLDKVYNITRTMVIKLGMSDLGYVSYKEENYKKFYSDQTNHVKYYINKQIDQEVKKIIDLASERTRILVKQHEKDIQKLADSLLEQNTLDLKQLNQILGVRPFKPKSNYKAFLEIEAQENKEQVLKEA